MTSIYPLLALSGFGWFQLIILMVIAGGALLIYVILPFLIFLAALFETIRIPTFDPLASHDIPAPHPALNAALAAGFQLVGHFTDGDRGIRRGIFICALNADGTILLRILRSRINTRLELITPYSEHRWLITADITGTADLSGLDNQICLPSVPFDILLHYHRWRMLAIPQSPIAFTIQALIPQKIEHYRHRVDLLIEGGLARYLDVDRTRWKFTPAGAWKLIGAHRADFSRMRSQAELARTMKEQVRYGLLHTHFPLTASSPPSAPPTTPPPPPESPLPQ